MMKKKLLVLLVVALMLFTAACSSSKDGEAGDSSESEAVVEETSDSSDSEDTIYLPEAGMTFDTPKTYIENQDKVYLYAEGYAEEEGLYEAGFYIYPNTYDELTNMDDTDFFAAEDLSVNALTVFRAGPDWPKEDLVKYINWVFGIDDVELEDLGTDGDYTIYAFSDTGYSDDLPEDIKPIYDGIISELEESKNNIIFSEPISYAELDMGETLSFTSSLVTDDTEVTSQELFGDNKYTMINCWTSWCGPCIQEMPELEALSKEFQAQGCNIVGILMDADQGTGLEDGLDIIADTGVTFPVIGPWDTISDDIHVTAYPTTYFVDSNGTIVGEPVVGADINAYKEIMNELLD